MKSKTKLITTLATLCTVLVVAIISMGIIWAATTQNVRTSIRITYSVTDVICDVSAAKYFTSANTKTDFTTMDGQGTVISFSATTAQQGTTDPNLQVAATALTSTDQIVIFEYKFINNGSNTLTAALGDVAGTNLDVYVLAPQATQLTNPVSTFDATDWTHASSIAATNIAAGATAYAYVAMKIADDSQGVDYTGNFVWTLVGNN